MLWREKPGWEQREEEFIQRYFGPLLPVIGISVFAVLQFDLPLGVAVALIGLVAACGIYLAGLLTIAFWRRRKLRHVSRDRA